MDRLRYLTNVAITTIFYCLSLSTPALDQTWSEPRVLVGSDAGGIGRLSSVSLGPDETLHFSWLARKDTLVYMTINNGNLYEPLFKKLVDPAKSIITSQVVVDQDTIAHLFWFEKKLFLEDSTYQHNVVALNIPVHSTEPHYGPWICDSLWYHRAFWLPHIAACVTRYGAIYVCWSDDFDAMWLSSKNRGQFSQFSRPVKPFAGFEAPAGGAAMMMNLFTGSHNYLFLTFIGSTETDAAGVPNGGYLNFLYYAQKPLNSGRWDGPVLIYKNFRTAGQWPVIIADQQAVRHIIWLQLPDPAASPFISNLFYTYSKDGQQWAPPADLAKISAFIGSHQIVVDSRQTVHVFWIQYRIVKDKPAGVYYVHGREDQWSTPELIFESTTDRSYNEIRLALDSHDRLYLVQSTGVGPPGGIYYRKIEYLWKDLYLTDVTSEPKREEQGFRDLIMIKNYPNPFNETTTLSIAPRAECYVSLRIYNINGQCVRRLLTARLLKGETKLQWDGRNDQGVPLPSGVYYFHLTSYPQFQRQSIGLSGKVVLLR